MTLSALLFATMGQKKLKAPCSAHVSRSKLAAGPANSGGDATVGPAKPPKGSAEIVSASAVVVAAAVGITTAVVNVMS